VYKKYVVLLGVDKSALTLAPKSMQQAKSSRSARKSTDAKPGSQRHSWRGGNNNFWHDCHVNMSPDTYYHPIPHHPIPYDPIPYHTHPLNSVNVAYFPARVYYVGWGGNICVSWLHFIAPVSCLPSLGLPAAPVACRTISEHGLLWLPRVDLWNPLPFSDTQKPTGSPWDCSILGAISIRICISHWNI